jgi:predicted thioesterase
MTEPLAPGLTGEASVVVDESMLAVRLGSGSIRVYGTPALVALLERAAVAAVENVLTEGSTTVGVRIETTHVAPSPLGAVVQARAALSAVDGRKLTFRIEAFDEVEKIAEAIHDRVIVDGARLEARANAKASRQAN